MRNPQDHNEDGEFVLLPSHPVYFKNLAPEDQAEGLALLRQVMRQFFPNQAPSISDEQLAEQLANFDLRMLIGNEDALDC